MEKCAQNKQWLLTLTTINTLILFFSGIPAMLTDPIPEHVLSLCFYITLCLAQSFLFATLLGIFLSLIFFCIRSDRLKIALSILPTTLLLFGYFMNAKVFAFWRVNINSGLVKLYFSKGGGSQVFEVHGTLYWWLAMVAVIYLSVSVISLLFSRRLKRIRLIKYCLGFFVLIYLAAQSSFIYLCTQNNMSFLQYATKIPLFYELSWANGLHQVRVHLFPKHSTAARIHAILTDDKPLHYPTAPLRYHPPKHPLNVLLIVVDTLRYDMVNPMNMPNVYRFAQNADQFQDNLSGGDCTRPGIFSLFYGIPSTYWHNALIHHQGSILIRAFQANHYQMGLYASAPLTSPPFEKTVFATVKNLQAYTPGKTPMARDIKITDEMQDFLNHVAKNHKPFFGFLFYDGPHAYNVIPLHRPFHPIGYLDYFHIDNETDRTPFFNLYKNVVLADDHLLGRIFSTLHSDHLMHNTVVIITADHGQEFNDDKNNYWEHASGFSTYQMRTPMIIAWPNRKPVIMHYQTTHFDLTPTLLKRVLGVSNPIRDYSVGIDFFTSKQTSFDIAGNYAYFALITQDDVMQFHQSGLYRFTNHQMKPLADGQLSTADFSRLMREMTMY